MIVDLTFPTPTVTFDLRIPASVGRAINKLFSRVFQYTWVMYYVCLLYIDALIGGLGGQR